MKFHAFIFFILASCVTGFALSPPPGASIQSPKISDTWDSADQVIYGKIVGLVLMENYENEKFYQVTIRIEKTWKGEAEKYKVLIEREPLGDGVGYNYRLGMRYVVFIDNKSVQIGRCHAFQTDLKTDSVSKGLFGEAWLKKRTDDFHTNEEIEALIEFLSTKPEVGLFK